MKNSTWIIIFSVVIVICCGLWLLISNLSYSLKIVGIYQNGELVERINLDTVTEQRKIILNGDHGNNTILVTNEHIKMESADCPDKICVKHGELTENTTPIVCLPNRIVIKFENSNNNSDVDIKAGAAG